MFQNNLPWNKTENLYPSPVSACVCVCVDGYTCIDGKARGPRQGEDGSSQRTKSLKFLVPTYLQKDENNSFSYNGDY